MTVITFKELSSVEIKELTLNIEDLSPLGRTMLDGSDYVVFNGQFIDVYKDGTRVYQFGFTKYETNDWYGKEGYELVG